MSRTARSPSEPVVRDEAGSIDWEANGWPEPSMHYGSVDSSMIPEPYLSEWLDISYEIERWFEEN